MFQLLWWLFTGFLIGCVARWLHPAEENAGCGFTVAIGCGGSIVGGVLSRFALGDADGNIIVSIACAVALCAAWRYVALQNSAGGPRNFFTGLRK